jgi:hypothetical protein
MYLPVGHERVAAVPSTSLAPTEAPPRQIGRQIRFAARSLAREAGYWHSLFYIYFSQNVPANRSTLHLPHKVEIAASGRRHKKLCFQRAFKKVNLANCRGNRQRMTRKTWVLITFLPQEPTVHS